MKRLAILTLAIVLAACASPVPTEEAVVAPPEPTATPVVVIQTVVVEATQVPTEVPPPTEAPPTAAPVVVTVVVEPTQAPAVAPPTQAADQATSNTLIALDNAMGKGVFTAMTMSDDNITLRCTPRDITFNVTTPNAAIADVMFFYRIMDLGRLYPKEYKAFGKMTPTGNGNFKLTFTGENVHPDLRIDGSWLDFQFVGLAKSGNVVDRSQTIESLVKYTFDCP